MAGFHHVAYACRDLKETVRFYEALGFPLVHTEVNGREVDGVNRFFRHVFFDLGDGSSLAFFDLHGVGESEGWEADLAKGTGTPTWVNHFAFRADEARQADAKARMAAHGVEPFMDIDHGWCHSLYFLDPNGIMLEFCRDTPGFTPDREHALAQLDAQP